MPKKVAVDKATEKAMKKLGEKLYECRGRRSLRQIAQPSGISASQLLSIENGILAPTADVFAELIRTLEPTAKQRSELDKQYMAIRKTPPPDVCKTIIANQALVEALRNIDGIILTKEQTEQVKELLATFAVRNSEGEKNHAEGL